jgi:hypothetical protein
MVVHGIGWSLSWGCKLSIARDHDTGEHYVCVNTSGEDQRRGIVSRSTTREQIASFGKQLLNVFGEPDPRDAEIERLRKDCADNAEEWKRADAKVTRLRHETNERADEVLRRGAGMVERIRKALRVDDKGTTTRANLDVVDNYLDRLINVLDVEVRQHDQTKAERDAMHEALVVVQGVLRATEARLAATPAAPRRWVAGDAEPEIGTTLRSTTARTYTRRSDGSWHFLACPEGCPLPALWWTDLLAAAPLVEAVNTDG